MVALTFPPVEEVDYSINERLGMSELPGEVAKFTYVNNIETLGRFGFNSIGIKDAVRSLISINHSSNPERFMASRGNEACLWQPRNLGNQGVEDLEFESRLKDEVEVYFWDYNTGMINGSIVEELAYSYTGTPFKRDSVKRNKEPWHNLMQQRFLPLVKDAITGPVIYDYGTGQNSNEMITEFRLQQGKKRNWQIWAPLFDGAVTAYSCFVNGNLEIDSRNHSEHPSFVRYGHNQLGVWKGKIEDFVKQTSIIEKAFQQLNPSASGGASGEVKMIHPDLGMIVMRSEGEEYKAEHPDFYHSESRRVNAPKTMIFGKYAFGKLLEDFNR